MRPIQPAESGRRRPAALIAALLVLLVAAGVGVFGLLSKPAPAPDSLAAPTIPAGPPAATAPTPAPGGGAEGFARQAASVLFDWDTAIDTPQTIRGRLVGWGDPTGLETAGLAADISLYLPNPGMWETLAGYRTTQRLDITGLRIPAAWPGITASAPPGQILPGTLAYTIDGTRHREGITHGQAATAERPVSFTMFITCAPAFDRCHLMRLSQPDNPLR